MNKKIIYLVNHSSFFVSHRLELAIEMKKFFDVMLVYGKKSSKTTEPKAIEIINDNKIKSNKININNTGMCRLLDIFGFIKLIFIIFKFKPGIVHTVSPLANLIGGTALIFFKNIKLVMSISGMGFLFTDKSLFNIFFSSIYLNLLKLILKKKKLEIIVQNSDDYLLFTEKFKLKENVTLIKGSGINLNLYPNFNFQGKKNNIVLPARLIKEKGVIEFLDAAKIVKKKYNEWKFLIVGQFDYQSPSLLKINDLREKYGDIVSFIDYKSSLHDLFIDSSIVCLPSYREGMPKVILEASAAGCAIITTDVIGCRESIIHNYSGELISAKDYLELSKTIIKYIENCDLREIYGKNARNYALKYYSVESVIKKHFTIYNK